MQPANRPQDIDLTPRPVPHHTAMAADVTTAEDWLAHLAAQDGDPRQARARHLLAVDPATGQTRLGEIAELAWQATFDPGKVTADAVEGAAHEMAELIYEFSEDAGERRSPLCFLEPTVMLEVLETAVARCGLADTEPCGWPTRQLARLARVDVDIMEQILERDGIHFEPYGISLSEMAEMTARDQLYWYKQRFVWEPVDPRNWLAQFPGFVPGAFGRHEAAA